MRETRMRRDTELSLTAGGAEDPDEISAQDLLDCGIAVTSAREGICQHVHSVGAEIGRAHV